MKRLKKIPRPYLYLLAVSLAAIVIFRVERTDHRGDVLHRPLLENFDPSAVARIEIEHLLEGVQLEKREGKWMAAPFKTELKKTLEEEGEQNGNPKSEIRNLKQIRNLKSEIQNKPAWSPADAEKIDWSLSILQDVRLVSLAGSNPERHGYFEASPVGMQLRLFDDGGKKTVHLFIGKAGPAFTESYVRRDGEDNVYLADRFLRGYFSVDAGDWLEKEEPAAAPKPSAPKKSGSK